MSTNKAENENYAAISFKEKLGYGIGDFSTSLVFTAIGAFLSIFYTDVVGIAPAVIGTMDLYYYLPPLTLVLQVLLYMLM
ncbi:MAG TPA: hypothetical protein VGI33_01550 [Paenibacillus sp.]|jgi:GPH family glycoside/pentoside/hexuronide:cation symporter